MSVSGSRNRASIQSLISNATRPALSARSRWRAVILLSARKLTASSGISSTSGAPRKRGGHVQRLGQLPERVRGTGSWWPFSYREMLRVLRPVSPASWVRVRPRRLRAITSRDGVRAAAGPPGVTAG